MRTSNVDRLGLLILIGATLLGLFAPCWSTVSTAIREQVLPDTRTCTPVLVPALAYCPAQTEPQPGEQRWHL